MFQIAVRMLVARLTNDLVMETEFAVRARADAQVVAEGPIVKIMSTLLPWFCECGRFVVFISSRF